MSIPTIGGVPTRGETYAKLIHHLTECQECAAVLAHLHNTETKDSLIARGWLGIEEMFKLTKYKITQFAKRGLQ